MNPHEEMIKFFVKNFHEKGEPYIRFVCLSTLASNLFMRAYKRFPPIEELDQKEKLSLKKYVHEIFPGMSIPEKLKAAKVIYTLNQLL